MLHRAPQTIIKVMILVSFTLAFSWLLMRSGKYDNTSSRAVVKLQDEAALYSLLADYDARLITMIPELGLFVLDGAQADFFDQVALDRRVSELYSDSSIQGQPRYGGGVGPEPVGEPSLSRDEFPADYTDQWAVSTINLASAHRIARGEGTVVAVLDTGIDLAHPLFTDKLLPGYDFVDDDAIPAETRDGLDQDRDLLVDEGAGHGSHVAGIITLVAPQAKILPVRVFDDEANGFYSDVAAGIVYAVKNGADIINLSGSGVENAPFLAEAISYAEKHGVTVVTAAGVNALGFPAGYPSVISVGASDPANRAAEFSRFSERVNTLYAPGTSIFSGYDGGAYAVWTGNSMASAFVAGTAALLDSMGGCDQDCVLSSIVDTTDNVVADPGSSVLHGRIDAFQAVNAFYQAQTRLESGGQFNVVSYRD